MNAEDLPMWEQSLTSRKRKYSQVYAERLRGYFGWRWKAAVGCALQDPGTQGALSGADL